jgi:hypothetical protein
VARGVRESRACEERNFACDITHKTRKHHHHAVYEVILYVQIQRDNVLAVL